MATDTNIPTDSTISLSMLEQDPAPVYRRLRRETPVVRIEALGRIVFTKADDTLRIKTDTEHFGCHDTATPMQRAFRGHTLMRKDGPEHLKDRDGMMKAFAAETIEQHWRPAFEKIVDELLATLPHGKTLDLYNEFANPLVARYLQRFLGLDHATEEQLLHWASTLIKGAMNAQQNPQVFAQCDAANDEMDACFQAMIAKHRQAPNNSVLSVMSNANNPLAFSQIATNMRVCIAGSLVETRDGLLSTLYGLLSNPDQLKHCIEAENWRAACEEGLRWMAPIQVNARVVLKTTTIRGYRIPEGETVMIIQASANHDEALWSEPHLFDAHREMKPNQTFGNGVHQCPGSSIYKMLIADIVLPKLFRRFPQLALENPKNVVFRGFAFRGPTALRVLV